MPNEDNGKCMPFVIVGDEAFALSEHVLRPYANGNLSVQKTNTQLQINNSSSNRRMFIRFSGK